MEEVRVLAIPITVATDHLDQLVSALVVDLPALNAVRRSRCLKLSHDLAIVLHYPRHVLDPHCPVQAVVAVETTPFRPVSGLSLARPLSPSANHDDLIRCRLNRGVE